MKGQSHEDFARTTQHDPPSSRGFGFVFALLFGVMGFLPLLRAAPPRATPLGIAGALAVIATLRPSLLDLPARWWNRFAAALGKITNPLTMTFLFILVFVPTAALFRLFGKDPLLRAPKQSDSWWLVRRPPGPAPGSMSKQF